MIDLVERFKENMKATLESDVVNKVVSTEELPGRTRFIMNSGVKICVDSEPDGGEFRCLIFQNKDDEWPVFHMPMNASMVDVLGMKLALEVTLTKWVRSIT